MSKGFLVLAQNTDKVNYVEQAYALALSIKISQTEVNRISLVTNDNVPDKYKSAFDNIIEIPWGDAAEESAWKVENRWKLYHITPYDETIVLDTDMLLLGDITAWWDYCSKYDLKFCSNIQNYKLETVAVDNVNRRTFIENKLPNTYFALHYFKKSDEAHLFYKTLEFVIKNWELCYSSFAPNAYQNWLSLDLASSIALEITGMKHTAVDVHSPLTFVHMKSTSSKNTVNNWTEELLWNFTKNGELYVGNIKQPKVFHYVNKSFVTPQMLSTLKELEHAEH